MNTEDVGLSQPQSIRDPDFINAEAALHRAAQLARRRAWQAGIGVIVMKDGELLSTVSSRPGCRVSALPELLCGPRTIKGLRSTNIRAISCRATP